MSEYGTGRNPREARTKILGLVAIPLMWYLRHQAINLVQQASKSLVGQFPGVKELSISNIQHEYQAPSIEFNQQNNVSVLKRPNSVGLDIYPYLPAGRI